MIFVSIIIIVFGILQIMLFFKLWRMTNDVKRIKDNLINGVGASIDTAKMEFMIGNTDKAFEIFNKCFVNDTISIYREILYDVESSEMNKVRYETKYNEKCQVYQKLIDKLGKGYSIDFSRFDTFDKISEITP